MTEPRLTKEQKSLLADRVIEAAIAETDADRRRRNEKTARLRSLRLAQADTDGEKNAPDGTNL